MLIVGAGIGAGVAEAITMLQLNVVLPMLLVAVSEKGCVPAVDGVPTMPPPLCRTRPAGSEPDNRRHTTPEALVAVRDR